MLDELSGIDVDDLVLSEEYNLSQQTEAGIFFCSWFTFPRNRHIQLAIAQTGNRNVMKEKKEAWTQGELFRQYNSEYYAYFQDSLVRVGIVQIYMHSHVRVPVLLEQLHVIMSRSWSEIFASYHVL